MAINIDKIETKDGIFRGYEEKTSVEINVLKQKVSFKELTYTFEDVLKIARFVEQCVEIKDE